MLFFNLQDDWRFHRQLFHCSSGRLHFLRRLPHLLLWLCLGLRLFIEDGLFFSLLILDVFIDNCVLDGLFLGLLDLELHRPEERHAENQTPKNSVAEHWVI